MHDQHRAPRPALRGAVEPPGQARPLRAGGADPDPAQSATLTIAASVAADAFSRGSQIPVTPSDPTLFYRAASELLCENVAALVVDATVGHGLHAAPTCAGAIADMVEQVMGYPPGDPLTRARADPAGPLRRRADVGRGSGAARATNALRSTFALACESPTSLGIGL